MQGKMVPKRKLLKNIPLHVQKLKCRKGIYELKGHVREKVLRSSLPPKLGPAKRISFVSFSNYLLKNTIIEPTIPYGLLPHHKRAK
jgi:hypothetical protein